MSDRIQRAWELRRAVHGWIVAHAGCSMPDIKRAFARRKPDAVRMVVRRLVETGFVVALHSGRSGRTVAYRTDVAFTESPQAAREILRAIGRRAAPALVAASRTRARLADGTFAPPAAVALPGRIIGRQRHRPGKPIRNPDVIGSGGVRCGGHSSCERIA